MLASVTVGLLVHIVSVSLEGDLAETQQEAVITK